MFNTIVWHFKIGVIIIIKKNIHFRPRCYLFFHNTSKSALSAFNGFMSMHMCFLIWELMALCVLVRHTVTSNNGTLNEDKPFNTHLYN